MTQDGVENKPSETAFFAALHRALANKNYDGDDRLGPDDLAVVFLPPHFRLFLKFRWVRKNTKDRLDEAFPGLHAYMIARTAFFDDLVKDALREAIPQIVLLGAGYDSRPYRFDGLNAGTRFFELDVAPTQNRKRECLEKANITIPANVHLVPIDFNTQSIRKVLEAAEYDSGKRTLFLWEGVTYYLEATSVDATLDFFCGDTHPESRITFDYAVTVSAENIDNYGVRSFLQSMHEHHANEELMFAIEEDGIEAFLKARGLKAIKHMDSGAIERAYLTTDNGILIDRVNRIFRFVEASPAE